MKHTLAWLDDDAHTVTIDYRPVHTYTMTNDDRSTSSRRRGCIERQSKRIDELTHGDDARLSPHHPEP